MSKTPSWRDALKQPAENTKTPKSTVVAILRKAAKEGLIRHVNGDTSDNRVANLQRVTVLQAFQNKDWTVDAVCVLTEDEFEIWCKERTDWSGDLTIFQK